MGDAQAWGAVAQVHRLAPQGEDGGRVLLDLASAAGD
jgi:hypothetical protein